MDTSNHFEAIVQDLVNKVQEKVAFEVESKLEQLIFQKLEAYDFDSIVASSAGPALEHAISEYKFDTKAIDQKIKNVAEKSSMLLANDLHQQVVDSVAAEIKAIDIRSLISEEVLAIVARRLETQQFPENSISASAINFTDFKLSGNLVKGGIIENFGSLGIDDQATKCQLTILDTHVVIESPILTTGVDVRGDVKITGNLTIDGQITPDSGAMRQLVADTVSAVKTSLNKELFQGFSDLVTQEIRDHGIEFKEVIINDRLVLAEDRLGPGVTRSNLNRVGELDELQVKGETFVGRTLYASGKRVGINTLEPSAALSVWDEEVEIVVKKAKKDRGYIGTERKLGLSLGVGGQDNLSLDPDGSVTINDLRLGALPLSTASQEPNWSGRSGEIVFNDSPSIGKPIGWVCLEGHRWGSFGIIQ